jgi:hypothetical protein
MRIRPRLSVWLKTIAAMFFFTTMLVRICSGQTPGSFDRCPFEGKTAQPSLMALNRLKNRTVAPLRTNVNPAITLESVLAPGNDVGRWSPAQGAVIKGYVVAVKPGGQETVNCRAKDPLHTDTHIEIALGTTAARDLS